MLSQNSIFSLLAYASIVSALPAQLNISDPATGPIPSENTYYSDYRGKASPFPANNTSPVLPTVSGPPGPDDLLFQNLLGAEWAVYSFYQQGVEAFNTTSFTSIGFANTTYDRIQEIRDNEAGHLRIFQDSISNTSIKPGACKYDFGWSSAEEFLALQVLIEISSMAFAAGLVQQAKTNITKGALMGIGETETRHETWALIQVWGVDPFAGPIDTSFPQNLPQMSAAGNVTAGGNITFVYRDETNVPNFEDGKDYYAVFFHGLVIISVPFDTKTNSTVFPAELELKGMVLAVIAGEIGAPTEESVVAGPAFILEQPTALASLGI
ncbi:stress response rds1p protein [Rutstroemia sp. NJR-2017a BBW]|nr:stress response rds1p protein [Rutstroemia sp. NJR-2017a BBW]